MAIRIFLGLLAFLFAYQILLRVLSKTARRYISFPAPAFIHHFLDSRLRKRIQPPETIVRRSGVSEGMQVIDLGCGSGAFTLAMARAVGPQGRVYAVDIQPQMLRLLNQKLNCDENQDLRDRIIPLERSAYDLPFAEGSIDACCMIAALQEIPDRLRALREVHRVLKPDGILAISEFVIDPDFATPATTVRLAQEAGFHLEEIGGSFWNYTVRLRKAELAAG